MKTTEQDIRTLRKKAKTWLSSLTYYSTRGKINIRTFSRRLQHLFEPLFKPEIIQKALSDTVPEAIDIKEAVGMKKGIMSRLTPNKVSRRVLSYPEIPAGKAQTDQSPQEFIVKVFPNVSRIYVNFHDSTGCRKLSNEEYYRYPQESTCFLSGICRTLIQGTPEENLSHFMHTGIKALAIVIEMPGLEKEINKLLGQASHLMTKDATKRIKSALKANPDAKDKINIPELKALVLREEAKIGWRKNTETEDIKTLHNSLSPELKEDVYDNEEVIRRSLESVSRKGLFNNLHDALKGQLRPRFIDNIIHSLKSIARVESIWEFDASNLTQDSAASIRKWLFRR